MIRLGFHMGWVRSAQHAKNRLCFKKQSLSVNVIATAIRNALLNHLIWKIKTWKTINTDVQSAKG